MDNLKTRQKRVIKLKRRNSNIGLYNSSIHPYNFISIFAKKNYRITEEQIKSIKMDLLTPKGLTGGKLLKFFNIYITMKPNKVLTNKGILVRMGGGKSKVKTNVLFLTPGTICIIAQSKPSLNSPLLEPFLPLFLKFIKKYPFFKFKDF